MVRHVSTSDRKDEATEKVSDRKVTQLTQLFLVTSTKT